MNLKQIPTIHLPPALRRMALMYISWRCHSRVILKNGLKSSKHTQLENNDHLPKPPLYKIYVIYLDIQYIIKYIQLKNTNTCLVYYIQPRPQKKLRTAPTTPKQQQIPRKSQGGFQPPRLPTGSQSLKQRRSSFQAKDVRDTPTPASTGPDQLLESGKFVG